jgi:glycosyltransferase involved in cell wall biosynthesis
MKIAIVCQYYPPEVCAPALRMSSLAEFLAEKGHQVSVLTGFPNHPTGVLPPRYRGRALETEELRGVRVVRNWVYATPNRGFFKRVLNHISFMVSALLLGSWRLGPTDAVVATSPPFFAAPTAWALSVIARAPFIFEVRDLWPAILSELGILRNRFLLGLLERMEMFLYRRSAAVVVVTDSFKEILESRGVPGAKIRVVPNGVDLSRFAPGPEDPALRAELGLAGKFTALYLGTHGISQGLDSVLRAAGELSADGDVAFVLVGEGAEKERLARAARERGLRSVRFVDGQPSERVAQFYRLADVCLVPLRDIALFSNFIPSKMFEIMACAKPIVASLRGEAAEILARSGAAEVVAPEDAPAIARAVAALKADPARARAMGESGRRFVEERYQRRALYAEYERLLAGLRGGAA